MHRLLCNVLHCIVLHCVALHRIVLYCIVFHCIVLYCMHSISLAISLVSIVWYCQVGLAWCIRMSGVKGGCLCDDSGVWLVGWRAVRVHGWQGGEL